MMSCLVSTVDVQLLKRRGMFYSTTFCYQQKKINKKTKRKKTVHDLELFGYSGVSVAQGRARGLCGV